MERYRVLEAWKHFEATQKGEDHLYTLSDIEGLEYGILWSFVLASSLAEESSAYREVLRSFGTATVGKMLSRLVRLGYLKEKEHVAPSLTKAYSAYSKLSDAHPHSDFGLLLRTYWKIAHDEPVDNKTLTKVVDYIEAAQADTWAEDARVEIDRERPKITIDSTMSGFHSEPYPYARDIFHLSDREADTLLTMLEELSK